MPQYSYHVRTAKNNYGNDVPLFFTGELKDSGEWIQDRIYSQKQLAEDRINKLNDGSDKPDDADKYLKIACELVRVLRFAQSFIANMHKPTPPPITEALEKYNCLVVDKN